MILLSLCLIDARVSNKDEDEDFSLELITRLLDCFPRFTVKGIYLGKVVGG
jgi:hypothetical protein